MEETQEQIERHNRRDLWQDVANRLTVAKEEVEIAQALLEGDLREQAYADQLQPLFDDLRRAANEAGEKAGSA